MASQPTMGTTLVERQSTPCNNSMVASSGLQVPPSSHLSDTQQRYSLTTPSQVSHPVRQSTAPLTSGFSRAYTTTGGVATLGAYSSHSGPIHRVGSTTPSPGPLHRMGTTTPSIMNGNQYLTQPNFESTYSRRSSQVNFSPSASFRYQHGMSSTGLGHGCMRENSVIGEGHVISERIVEHEVRVPKKIVREDIVERVILVPEKFQYEEMVEGTRTVREKIIEIAKPIYQERIEEVPEIEYIEKIVEVPEIVYQEKVREVPRIEYQERIIEVPKIITQERIVEVPEIQYIEIPVEKIIEVPEIREQVVLKEVPVTQYVDRPVPEYVNVEIEQETVRHIPVPVEAVTVVQFRMPKLRPRYIKQDLPFYVPRFIEIAVPTEFMEPAAIAEIERYAQQVTLIASQTAVSMGEVERLAGVLKDLDEHYSSSEAQGTEKALDCMNTCWSEGRFAVANANYIPLVPLTVAVGERDLGEDDDQQSFTDDGSVPEEGETNSDTPIQSAPDEFQGSTMIKTVQSRIEGGSQSFNTGNLSFIDVVVLKQQLSKAVCPNLADTLLVSTLSREKRDLIKDGSQRSLSHDGSQQVAVEVEPNRAGTRTSDLGSFKESKTSSKFGAGSQPVNTENVSLVEAKLVEEEFDISEDSLSEDDSSKSKDPFFESKLDGEAPPDKSRGKNHN